MTQGKRISTDIGDDALQTIGRVEAGEPGVSIGHMVGLLALYGVAVRPQPPQGG